MQLRKIGMLWTLCFFLLTASAPLAFGADVAKIGTVNFQNIFENSLAGKAVKDEVNSEGQRMESDLKQRGEEIKALEKQLQQGADVMSKEARDEQRWELERKIADVKALKKKYDRQIQELQMRLVNEVRQDVLSVISSYAQKEGYLLIVEDISVVYVPKNLDITDTIIKLYNDQYAKQGKKRQGPKG